MPAGRIYEDGANEILKAFFDIGSPPATLEIGLLTGMPSEEADATSLTGLEPVGNGYARLSVSTGSGEWGLVGDGIVGNLNELAFGTATGDWGVITHWFVKIGGGSPILVVATALAETWRVRAGIAPKLEAGAVAFSLSTIDDPVIA